jgi:hypothetical protein
MYKKIFAVLFVASFLIGNVVSASLLSGKLNNSLKGDQQTVFANEAGYSVATNGTTLTQMIADAIAVFLGLLGVIFVILIVMAGYRWMTAGGDAEKASKAGRSIYAAIIGLIIVVGAYAITYFVFRSLPESQGGGTTTIQSTP